MIKDKNLLYLLLVLAVILTSACQREEQTAVNDTNAEKEVVLSTHISNKKVNGICEDQYGQIWIGTFRGLNKYDGTKYHQYFCVDDSLGLPDNQISSIYKDSRNRLWVTTVNGICFYNKKGKFTRVSLSTPPEGNKYYTKVFEDKKGRLFFTTGSSLYLSLIHI